MWVVPESSLGRQRKETFEGEICRRTEHTRVEGSLRVYGGAVPSGGPGGTEVSGGRDTGRTDRVIQRHLRGYGTETRYLSPRTREVHGGVCAQPESRQGPTYGSWDWFLSNGPPRARSPLSYLPPFVLRPKGPAYVTCGSSSYPSTPLDVVPVLPPSPTPPQGPYSGPRPDPPLSSGPW